MRCEGRLRGSRPHPAPDLAPALPPYPRRAVDPEASHRRPRTLSAQAKRNMAHRLETIAEKLLSRSFLTERDRLPGSQEQEKKLKEENTERQKRNMHHLDQYLTTGHHSLAKLRHKINHHAMTCELKIGCEQTSRSLPVLTQGSLYSKERSPVLQA